MEERKDIERLFQEKFKNFEAAPSLEVWNAIENKLQKKKKRRVLPIWWFASGIAASLLIGILLFNKSNIKNDEVFEENPVVIEELKTDIKVLENPIKVEDSIQTEIVLNETKKEVNKKNKSEKDRKRISSGLIEKKIATQKPKEKREDKSEGFLSDQKNAMEKIFSKELEKKDIKTVIAKNNTVLSTNKKKDFIAELKKLDSTQVVVTNNKKKKWTVTPTVGVLNANSFSNASPLDQSLAANTSGNNSVSFGVKVDYKLNDKWSLQTGIYQQNVDFSANNLAVVSNVTGSDLNNVNYSSDVSFLISNNETLSDAVVLSGANIVSHNATLQQTYGYIEVPIEVKYTVLQNEKFNTRLISGFSTLFLNKNNLSLESSNTTRNVGKATNLNSVNFSGNFGLDFNYSLNKNFNLNISPIFKVQMNTFSNSANGFRPYTIGVYSGLSYKF
ncbi:hypothetical protein WH52_04870 [Tenacibaculum holothuriorum]|uniref:Outer membrane protein beta-barrel domain-containing protein n=1 Tax=Tenacibaculum holothuriorum TaxID=1635173 RepID=A0A1Y2PER9_9FLAO|nr:outer membrane beta-barrel protein [Tenacibaculum holothuriorum]OSY88996.1 hypothetical protein WH52_04870 [Tenacibaculum holothuriorum]